MNNLGSVHILRHHFEGGVGGRSRRMMTLLNFLMGNYSNIDDEGGKGGQKGHFRDDVICQRSLSICLE